MMKLMWLYAVVALALAGLVYLLVLAGRRDRLERQRQAQADSFALTRQACEEDLALLASDVDRSRPLDELGVFVDEVWTAAHDAAGRASELLVLAESAEDLTEVCAEIAEARQALATVEFAVLDEPLDEAHPCCFFNPNHGPAEAVVAWTTDDGERVRVPSCAADAGRIASGATPFARTFPVGDQRVPWWLAGEPAVAWARGWFAAWRDTPVWEHLATAAPELDPGARRQPTKSSQQRAA